MSGHETLNSKVLTKPFMLFSVLALIGLYFISQRFLYGLGAVSNLNNGYPWGIWVVFDIVIGTGFATGGWAVALVVYVANRGRYHPLMRPAILASLLGYGLGGIAAFVDMGRYWNFYNLVVPGKANLNSVMLEVGLSVASYVTILTIEFAPAFLERFGLRDVRDKLEKVLFIFIGLGILLPMMHQSSLGSLLISAGHKIDPLWQSYELLPLLFLLTAIAMGYCVVIFEGSLTTLRFRRPAEAPLFEKLGLIMMGLVGTYLVLRFGELAINGKLGRAFAGDARSLMFWLENVLYIIPFAILSVRENRQNSRWLFLAALSMLAGGALYRLNAFLIGFNAPDGYQYFPSVPEMMVTVGMFSIEIVVFLYVIKRFPILHRVGQPA